MCGARNDAQVRELLKAGPVAVIEHGGSHDLSAAVKHVAVGKCAYLHMTTRRAKQLLHYTRPQPIDSDAILT